MTRDDSYLSAYLDDELDPGARREAEARLAADPGSAERAAALGRVGRLVGDLPRPAAPRRLAASVLAEVARARSARARRPVYRVATAASLGFAGLLAYRSALVDRPAPVLVVDHRPPPLPGPDAGRHPGVEPAPGDQAARPGVPEPAGALGPAPDAEAEARARLVALLDGPGMGRVLVPADPAGPDPAGRVERVLRESARKEPDFVRMAVPPGLGVDPAHPEGGVVIVARMDDLERREFVARLGVPATIEPEAAPALAGDLAELGGLAPGTGPSAAGLKPPPLGARVAFAHPEARPDVRERVVAGPRDLGRDPFANAPVADEPEDPGDHEFVGPPAPAGLRRDGPRPPGPVIIWVMTAGAGGR